MKLDRHTYEAWLLDRMEGRLTAEQERELAAFLLAHPDLDVAFDPTPLDLSGIDSGHPDKETLKRDLPPTGMPTAGTLADFLIARGEGDLTPEQDQALQAFIGSDPERAKSARQFMAAHIIHGAEAYGDRRALHRDLPPTGPVDRYSLPDHLIAALEGDLDPQGMQALNVYLSAHPEARREEALFHAAKVPADVVEYPSRTSCGKAGG